MYVCVLKGLVCIRGDECVLEGRKNKCIIEGDKCVCVIMCTFMA